MSDALRRGLRTALWFTLAMAGAIPGLAAALNIPAGRVAQIVAIFTFVGSVLTAVINFAEDKGLVPALLKAPPSPGADPIPDPEGGYVGILSLLVIVLIVLLLLAATGNL